MALSNNPVFVQAPKAASVKVTAANTNLDGTGTVATLLTAGADGSLVTSLKAMCQATVTATACRLFLSLDAGSTWALLDEKLMGAYTVAQTTAQTPVVFVDKTVPDAAIRLPASAKLGVTIGVALAGGIVFTAEHADF